MILIGIDPGAMGAVGFLDTRTRRAWGEVVDTKDGHALRDLLDAYEFGSHDDGSKAQAVVERVHSSPQMGVKSAFSFGESFGVIRGVLCALNIPHTFVTPAAWYAVALAGRARPKKPAEKKKAVLAAAREQFPDARLDRVKDGAIGEALFMARWLERDLLGR